MKKCTVSLLFILSLNSTTQPESTLSQHHFFNTTGQDIELTIQHIGKGCPFNSRKNKNVVIKGVNQPCRKMDKNSKCFVDTITATIKKGDNTTRTAEFRSSHGQGIDHVNANFNVKEKSPGSDTYEIVTITKDEAKELQEKCRR